ncbi:cation channel sperm-associated protein 2 isoform X2 [Cricetulus griseus]|nr:cation channel sperm-associated protein 2 isoform X2 [Cricetulus griseus]XP_007619736.1 cation channel sperm-associated protein 2 isoform X2 [Cricetulus griseus]XP_007619743.1 cation channel sperm-associated protein 2 isoform X2 [Cricetulus griseus]XP_027277829.1 cation channel sperm-associated protein 2 isoform X2 [Cricetulus griseus]XP_027277830.1 cation channel sperm-associated protein 2 isoform X2 [Cricetulus griseus]XP_027277831.1 cation channel sperm-associated protein 2 isoform X2 [C
MAQEQGHVPLPRADAIRSRLVDTFSLIEHLQGLSQAVPRHTLREILDPSRQKKLMSGDQNQLVRFSIKPRHMGHITHSQRMLSRLQVRCSRRPPLSLWAGWVLENPIFSKFIIFLIFLNTIVLMVEIELMESTNTKLWPLKLTLEVADWFILLSFILEIILMWMFSFSLFWNNAWNVFDFVVTMSSLLPEFVVLMGVSGNSVWLQLLRISRVLRSLKLFARFRQIKVIILALARALKSMTFLLMLLLIFFYIFAVTGVYFFEDYSRSTIENLEYNMFFSDLLNSLVTVFILFTLDHWYALLQDVWKVPEASRVFSSIYVILWLLLGSIIFRNIIVAMMVTNFQNIRNELSEEMTHLEVQYKADIFKRQIIQRRQNLSPEAVRATSHRKASKDVLKPKEPELSDSEKSDAETSDAETNDAETSDTEKSDVETGDAEKSDTQRSDSEESDTEEGEAKGSDAEQDEDGEGQKKSSKSKVYSSSSSTASSSSYSTFLVDFDYDGKMDWETLVHENLPGLMHMDQDDRVVWPRDSLFRYFELLEKLQYNLEERKNLQEFAVQALMSFEDK